MTKYGMSSSLPMTSRKIKRSTIAATNQDQHAALNSSPGGKSIDISAGAPVGFTLNSFFGSTQALKVVDRSDTESVLIEQRLFSDIVGDKDSGEEIRNHLELNNKNVHKPNKSVVLAADFLCDDEEYNLAS